MHIKHEYALFYYKTRAEANSLTHSHLCIVCTVLASYSRDAPSVVVMFLTLLLLHQYSLFLNLTHSPARIHHASVLHICIAPSPPGASWLSARLPIATNGEKEGRLFPVYDFCLRLLQCVASWPI